MALQKASTECTPQPTIAVRFEIISEYLYCLKNQNFIAKTYLKSCTKQEGTSYVFMWTNEHVY